MLKIRQVNEQQINAALNDIDKSISTIRTEAEAVKKNVAEESENTQKVIEGLSEKVDQKLTDLDSAIGDNIEYLNENFVPNTRTINDKPLSDDIVLTASDVGAATVNDITNAINGLDASSVGGDGKYIKTISETNGIISATEETMDTTPTANSTKAVTSGGVKSAIDTAESNAKNLANATGTLPVANGGTGATTAGGACTNLIGALTVADGDVTDATDIITSNNGGYAEQSDKQFYKRKGIKFWNYIKGKIGNVIKAVSANGFWGMADPNGADNVWIRTTTQGIVPYVSGSKGSGHQMLGTSSWYFSHGYIDNLHSVNVEADTVTANGYQLKRYYEIDTRSLSASNFYPVTFNPSDLELDCEIHSPNLGGGDPYNQNHIHFLLTWQGWYDTPKRLTVLSYGVYDVNEITIGCIGTGNQNGANCVWIRGGRIYRFYCNRTPTLRTADWSYGSEKFTVGTSQSGGTNANVTTSFKPSDYTAYGSYFKDMIYGSIYSSQRANYTYGTALCTTAGATAAKTASMIGYAKIPSGSSNKAFLITFTETNTIASALTLNINGQGALPIVINGTESSASNYTINAGTYICTEVKNSIFQYHYYAIEINNSISFARSATSISTYKMRYSASTTDGIPYMSGTNNTSPSASAPHYGYRVFSDGLKICWGRYLTGDTNPVTLPVTFTSATSYSVAVVFMADSSGKPNYEEFLKPYSATQIKHTGGNYEQRWIAIGY